jgi:hypothetical protein
MDNIDINRRKFITTVMLFSILCGCVFAFIAISYFDNLFLEHKKMIKLFNENGISVNYSRYPYIDINLPNTLNISS